MIPPHTVIHLDGSQHSGSGTLVRFGVSLAALVGEPLHITRALTAGGLTSQIECVEDESATQAGASLAVWAQTETGCCIGADRAGARGRSSESIGRDVARSLLEDHASGAATDRHLAGQLVLFAGARGGPQPLDAAACHRARGEQRLAGRPLRSAGALRRAHRPGRGPGPGPSQRLASGRLEVAALTMGITSRTRA